MRNVLGRAPRVAINRNIRVKVLDRYPTAAGARRQPREWSGYRLVGEIAADVKATARAPRQFSQTSAHVFKIEELGFPRNAYWWARLNVATTGAVYRVMNAKDELWLMLMTGGKQSTGAEDPAATGCQQIFVCPYPLSCMSYQPLIMCPVAPRSVHLSSY